MPLLVETEMSAEMSGGGCLYVGDGIISRSLSLVDDAADVEHGEWMASKSELESVEKGKWEI